MSVSKLLVTGAVTAAALAAVGTGTVSAASSTSTNQTKTPMNRIMRPRPRDGGKPVTDAAVISKVKAAVQSKYHGYTIDHVIKLPNGSYLALSRNVSGNRVIVNVSKNYEVTGTKSAPSGMPPRRQGWHMAMRHIGPPKSDNDADD